MRNAFIALTLAALPLCACATTVEHKQVSRAQERDALVAVEKAYAEAFAAYETAVNRSPEQRLKAHQALMTAHSALQATLNAFETDGASTFMDQASAAKKLAEDAKAAAG